MQLAEAFVRITAHDAEWKKGIASIQTEVSQVTKGMEDKFKDAGQKITSVGKNLSLKATAPIAAIGAGVMKLGMDFEASMSEVGAISGATEEELKLLEAKAKELGATTKFSASEAADGLKYMSMAGWDTQKMLDALPGVLSLAAASGENLGTVSDIVTDAMTAFGMEADRAGEFADILAAASSNANTNVSMLGESFKYVAPVAGALGYSAKDVSVALGLMANAGIKGSQSGTAMRAMLSRLVKPTKESGTSMEQLGISILDSEGKMKSLAEIMDDLRRAFKDLDPDQQAFHAAQIAGQEAMSGLLAIVNTSEEDFNKLSDAINNSSGAAEKMEKEMMNNLQGRLTELKSAIEGVALQLYDAMQPALEAIIRIIQKLVDWFAKLSPTTKTIIVTIAGIVAAIGPLLIILGILASSIGAIISILPVLAGAFAILTGPIGLAVAAIVGLIAIGTLLVKNWDKIAAELKKIWKDLKAGWTSGLDSMKKAFTDFGKQISDLWTKTWNGIKDFFAEWGKTILLLAIGPGGWAILLAQKLGITWNDIKNTASRVWEDIKYRMLNPVESAKNTILNIINTIKNAFTNLRIEIPKPKLPRISVNWKSVGVGSAKVSIPDFDLKWYSRGTNFHPGGWAVVGEEGPELLKLPTGSQVVPNNKMNGVLGKESKGDILITGNTFYVRKEDDIERIARELDRLRLDKSRGRGYAF